MICQQCGVEFTPKRSDQKFCGGKCKTAFGRKKIVVSDRQVPLVSDKDVSGNVTGNVTVNVPDNLFEGDGICKVCFRKIVDIPEQWVDAPNAEQAKQIEVCLPCVRKKPQIPGHSDLSDCVICNKGYKPDEAFLASCLEDEEGGFIALADNRRAAHRAKWILNHHTLKELEDYNLKGEIFIPNWKRKEVYGDFQKEE